MNHAGHANKEERHSSEMQGVNASAMLADLIASLVATSLAARRYSDGHRTA